MPSLEAKIAIVTGAASGQGAAIAELFVQEGAKVAITDVNEPAGRALAEKLGADSIFCKLDVSKAEDWEAVTKTVEATFGAANVLINNAGIFQPKSLQETSQDDWDLHYRINQLAIFLGMKAVVPAMIEAGGGLIVNTASNSALRGIPGMFSYCSTKWAVRGMTKAAAADLAPFNVRVNTVLPGIIDTPLYRSNGPEKCAVYDTYIGLGRRGEPAEIAGLMAYLASDSASYFSGAEITMDGAMFL